MEKLGKWKTLLVNISEWNKPTRKAEILILSQSTSSYSTWTILQVSNLDFETIPIILHPGFMTRPSQLYKYQNCT